MSREKSESDTTPDDSQSKSEGWVSVRSYLHRVAKIQVKQNKRFDHSDVVQQTLLEAQQQPAESIPEEPLKHRRWLRKILLHNILDAHRSSRRKKRDTRREVQIDSSEAGGLANLPANALMANQSSPSQGASRNEMITEVRGIVANLPEDNRRVIEMRFFEHRDITDIAQELNRNEAAVSALLYRSLQLLKEKMTKQAIVTD